MGNAYNSTRPMQGRSEKVACCILCAGVARRLEPISAVIAKPAFPLGGRVPIAELWVRKFVESGITDISMNLFHVPRSISDYFGNGHRFLADIRYAVEQGAPSGTLGGALKMLRALKDSGIRPERVFIPSGDIVSNIAPEQLGLMLDSHMRSGAAVSLMLAPIPWERRGDFGTVVLEGVKAGQEVPNNAYLRVTSFVEKDPNSVSRENNGSNYIIETSLLEELEPYLTPCSLGAKDPCYDFGKHIFQGMMGKVPHLGFLTKYSGSIFGFEPRTDWYDVGNKRDYLDVNRAVLSGGIQTQLPYTRFPWGWMGSNADLDLDRITIIPPVIIGDNVTVFPGAVIGPNVVLGDNWVVHRKAAIRNSVLWPPYDYTGIPSELSPSMRNIREVREAVEIEGTILVGGIITADMKDKTVNVLPDGRLDVRDIEWVPQGPRP